MREDDVIAGVFRPRDMTELFIFGYEAMYQDVIMMEGCNKL